MKGNDVGIEQSCILWLWEGIRGHHCWGRRMTLWRYSREQLKFLLAYVRRAGIAFGHSAVWFVLLV